MGKRGGGVCARTILFLFLFLVMLCIKMFVNFCMFCTLVYY